ncbi:hypothetical protein OJF2_43340 [Aquisphaera giovannonii]|uniref:Uncharacterized protein n=1 Tax=Aquisphaera giovannonii TaxID=406548 RepID=A0A5B9W619_9BACT|nr:hypothetical protein [Aquisphaera giovannonii]QEH35777.1 hypothetical protein OJF2_43340 [Aquisphaera giovannonii]
MPLDVTPHDASMIADAAARLASGMAVMLLATSWREVPLRFLRTHCVVILGLLVLAALDDSRAGGTRAGVSLLGAGAFLAYVGATAWGLGLPRVAIPATWLLAGAAAAWLAMASGGGGPAALALAAAGRYASGFVLGATLTAMLLGHHYLTAPAMSIEPLKRYVKAMGWGLLARGLVGVAAMALAHRGVLPSPAAAGHLGPPLLLLMRWGMGFAAPALATALAWKTAQIRSTQSATGILYVAMTLLLVGELTAMIAARAGAAVG